METLTTRDLRHVLQCLRQLYASADLDTFQHRLLTALPLVVPSEATSYNEVNPRQQRLVAVLDPVDTRVAERLPALAQCLHEHPHVQYYQRTRDGRARKISDFLSRRQFQSLGLYNEFYRHVDVEYQMAITLPAPPPLVIGIALNRSHSDFTERERLLLNLLRPHLVQAYHNATAVTRLLQAMEAAGQGVLCLTRQGQVQWMTAPAQQWVVAYFGPLPNRGRRLPASLWRWITQQQGQFHQDDTVPSPRTPLVVERQGKRLLIRLLTTPPDDACLVLLEEQPTTASPVVLEALGLGRREAEVLFWVAQGKTTPEIALILSIRVRTVEKHLERLYAKLGVETRTAAAMRALEALGYRR